MEAHERVLTDRISTLISYRRWIKRLLAQSPDRAPYWRPLDAEYRAELRALIRLVRAARKLDPIDQYKSYRDWTEAEKAEAWGR